MKIQEIQNRNYPFKAKIGKTGRIRFGQETIDYFKMKRNNHYSILFDADEKNVTRIYISETDKIYAPKLIYSKGWFIRGIFAVSFLKIKVPVNCIVSKVEVSKHFPKGAICLTFN